MNVPPRLRSRKLWTAVLIEAVHVSLLSKGHIEADHFVTLTLFVLGGWFGGEANEKWTQR